MKRLVPLFILLLNHAFAQEIEVSKTRTVLVNDSSGYSKCDILNKKVRIVTDTAGLYHWFITGKIHVSKGGYEGNLLHGDYSAFYPSDNLRQKGRFYYGLRDGEWKAWHPGGELKELSQWKKGARDGRTIIKNEKGQLVSVTEYKGNMLHGIYQEYTDNKPTLTRRYKNNRDITKKPRVKKEKVKKAEKVKEAPKPVSPEPAAATAEPKKKEDSGLKKGWKNLKQKTGKLFKSSKKDKNVDNKAREKDFKDQPKK